MTESGTLEARIKSRAREIGFDLVGIATLGPPDTASSLDEWLSAGYAGEMHYLERGAEKRRDTRLPYEGARSAVVVAMNYGGTQPPGPIARYARGDDYHDVMVDRLNELHRWIEASIGSPVRGKAYVDTGPILERDLAQRAGLGWIGKSTNLINPTLGSFFFLGELLLDLELRADGPFNADHCGSCTRCLDACPTNAFVAPRVLDATRCISYQTIEQKGPIAETLREAIGEHLYGCDVCQDVCPWNVKFSRELSESVLAPHADKISPSPLSLMAMSSEDWRDFSRSSPTKRSKRRGFLRNVAVVLGNRGTPDAVPALVGALDNDESLVREHAAWALERIGDRSAREPLRARESRETDTAVIAAVRSAIRALDD